MLGVHSVKAMRSNRKQCMESKAREHPPQQAVAPNVMYVTGCCIGSYRNPIAAAHGGEVCPAAVAEKVRNIFEREKRGFQEPNKKKG